MKPLILDVGKELLIQMVKLVVLVLPFFDVALYKIGMQMFKNKRMFKWKFFLSIWPLRLFLWAVIAFFIYAHHIVYANH
jgi:hypothetical protein